MSAARHEAYCVFCGSSPGARPDYAASARALGEELARRGIRLVYGGANVGLMGEVADASLAHGGSVTGVIPASLVEKEVAHYGLEDLRIVASMHERKSVMADLADGFVALPGGYGTLEELLEILTWAQLGSHAKPCALLNVCGYFDPLREMLDRAVVERFLSPAHREMLIVSDSPGDVLDRMAAYEAVEGEKWLDRPAR